MMIKSMNMGCQKTKQTFEVKRGNEINCYTTCTHTTIIWKTSIRESERNNFFTIHSTVKFLCQFIPKYTTQGHRSSFLSLAQKMHNFHEMLCAEYFCVDKNYVDSWCCVFSTMLNWITWVLPIHWNWKHWDLLNVWTNNCTETSLNYDTEKDRLTKLNHP